MTRLLTRSSRSTSKLTRARSPSWSRAGGSALPLVGSGATMPSASVTVTVLAVTKPPLSMSTTRRRSTGWN